MNRPEQLKAVQLEALKLFEKKNKDYGDSIATYGPVGVIVRLGDKITRLSSITQSSVNLIKSESVRDTLIDLHNYAAMAIMLMDEKEKEKTENVIVENHLTNSDSFGHELSLEDEADEEKLWGQFKETLYC